MIAHIQLELEALYTLAQELTVGGPVIFDCSFDMTIDDDDISIVQIHRNSGTYLLTIEGSGDNMALALRSTEITDLLITLPSPMYLTVGKTMKIGDSVEA
tara:strand:- start:3839 stop:4138 length:300 start_codon:yes stop_codon:yes gene_type:complete